MIPLDLLQQLDELDEHTRIEAKTANELSDSGLETLSGNLKAKGAGQSGLSGNPWGISGNQVARQGRLSGMSDQLAALAPAN